jgi:exonuclease III
VNYADDFVIVTHPGGAEEATAAMRRMMEKLRLTVNETKTRICRLPEESFDFLGYTFGRQYSPRNGRAYLGRKPAKKKIRRLCGEISAATDRRTTWQDVRDLVEDLNAKLRGWSNYFCVGTVVPAYETIMKHTRHRLRRWLGVKHKVRGSVVARYPSAYLHEELGLHLLPGCTTGWKRANP